MYEFLIFYAGMAVGQAALIFYLWLKADKGSKRNAG